MKKQLPEDQNYVFGVLTFRFKLYECFRRRDLVPRVRPGNTKWALIKRKYIRLMNDI